MISEKLDKLHPEFMQKAHCIIPSSNDPLSSSIVDAQVYRMPNELSSTIKYQRPRRNNFARAVGKCCSFDALQCLYRTIPILYWLPRYSLKKSLTGDIVAGITVAILNIPQGMAYALLGNVPPIVGIYMAFIPVLVYVVLGTSRHNAMGTFGIVCLMVGNVVARHANEENPVAGSSYTNLEVAITVTFMVAMIQFLMYFFRLGVVTNILSESLVKSLTCACACYVVVSQLKDLFGLPIVKRRGYFSLPLTIYDSVRAVPQGNQYALLISIVVCSCLLINNHLKPLLAKRTKIPIPIELIAVCMGTFVSYLCNFEQRLQIRLVGDIPTGLPHLKYPMWDLMPQIVAETMVIAIISYVISMSMALMTAQKDHYEIDGNQELLAMAAANTLGSFFSCMPISASLSRSVVAHDVGGTSQLSNVVSSSLLLLVLLWIGPVFSFLPRCVLASIIMVAIKSLLEQITLLPKFWRQSKWDGMAFLVTWCTTVLISIEVGLVSGLAVSIFNLFFRGQQAYTCLLGVVPRTDLYLDMKRFKGVVEIPGIKIFHYCGSFNFASKAMFKSCLLKSTINANEPLGNENNGQLMRHATLSSTPSKVNSEALLHEVPLACIIVDFSALTYIDPSGVDQLRTIRNELRTQDVDLLLAGCSGPVFETIRVCDAEAKSSERFRIFLRIHDAVAFAKTKEGEVRVSEGS